ncbi:hypothetical protein [Candidatus Sororendozoicomonas aggregata]|uniref:hypothetical protein n=1 Tax=Candidatus Sororendozoicomonas aggregata TaxID=3073239 RepID=UPI002ED5B77D
MKKGIIARVMAIAIALSNSAGADWGAVKTQVTQELMVDRYARPEFQDLAHFRQQQRQRMAAMTQERADYLPALQGYRQRKDEKKVVFVSAQGNKTFKKVLKFTDTDTAKKSPSINDRETPFLNPLFPVTEQKQVKSVKSVQKSSTEVSVRPFHSVNHIRKQRTPRGKIKGKIKVTVTDKR